MRADAAVAVTGPWTNALASPLGETLPITPLRVQMVHLRRPPPLERLTATVIDHTTGAYYRGKTPGFTPSREGRRRRTCPRW